MNRKFRHQQASKNFFIHSYIECIYLHSNVDINYTNIFNRNFSLRCSLCLLCLITVAFNALKSSSTEYLLRNVWNLNVFDAPTQPV